MTTYLGHLSPVPSSCTNTFMAQGRAFYSHASQSPKFLNGLGTTNILQGEIQTVSWLVLVTVILVCSLTPTCTTAGLRPAVPTGTPPWSLGGRSSLLKQWSVGLFNSDSKDNNQCLQAFLVISLY